MARVRLDQLMVTKGLAQSRERARALVMSGQVRVNGDVIAKAGAAIDDGAAVTVETPDHPWASRAGVKLAHALEAFHIDPAELVALDIGASTGGFTDVLIQRGAARVVALDVGRGQLDWRLRSDARVVVVDGINARHLTADDLPANLRQFDLVTVDVAFISLRHILPVIPPLLSGRGRVVALVKPQFEAGRDDVGKGGIVRDPAVHARVLEEITMAARTTGLERLAVEPSPITGAEGNKEFFMLLTCAPA